MFKHIGKKNIIFHSSRMTKANKYKHSINKRRGHWNLDTTNTQQIYKILHSKLNNSFTIAKPSSLSIIAVLNFNSYFERWIKGTYETSRNNQNVQFKYLYHYCFWLISDHITLPKRTKVIIITETPQGQGVKRHLSFSQIQCIITIYHTKNRFFSTGGIETGVSITYFLLPSLASITLHQFIPRNNVFVMYHSKVLTTMTRMSNKV